MSKAASFVNLGYDGNEKGARDLIHHELRVCPDNAVRRRFHVNEAPVELQHIRRELATVAADPKMSPQEKRSATQLLGDWSQSLRRVMRGDF